jgi:hypothetical protein
MIQQLAKYEPELQEKVDRMLTTHEHYGIPQIDYMISNLKVDKAYTRKVLLHIKKNRLWAEEKFAEIEEINDDEELDNSKDDESPAGKQETQLRAALSSLNVGGRAHPHPANPFQSPHEEFQHLSSGVDIDKQYDDVFSNTYRNIT